MRLWVRAEASPSVGLGHLMRGVALAEVAAEAGWEVTFVVDDVAVVAPVLARRGLAAIAADRGWTSGVGDGEAVVFDGYGLPSPPRHACRQRGAVVVVCDDTGRGPVEADIVVNPSPPRSPGYVVPDGTAVLLGPRYALVRQEFRRRRTEGPRPATGTLVVTMGGADPAGRGPQLAEAAVGAGRFERVVLVQGPLAGGQAVPAGVDVVVAPPNLAELFDSAQAAVAAAGTTTWELLCLGVPTALVVVADNQRPVVEVAVSAGAALVLEEPDLALQSLADPEEAGRLRDAAMALVDGRGAERVLGAVISRAGPS